MDTSTRVQILDKTLFIPQSINDSWKGMHPIIILPAMGE